MKSSATRFDYVRFKKGSAPIVPIEVRGKRHWHKVWCYVDSGAYYSVLRPEVAKHLKVDELQPRKVLIATSGGHSKSIKLYRLAARIGSWQGVVTFGVPHGFDIDFNLLGRRNVFNEFAITFDDSKAVVTFKPKRRRKR
ncbi:MAG: aspartyl protease family protein [Candidatus Omnitrophica bacterium]|nr:aspartyl protease family protein [Candidatus Omnitrophota bacterium]